MPGRHASIIILPGSCRNLWLEPFREGVVFIYGVQSRMRFDSFTLIMVLGAAQGFFLAAILAGKSINRVANRLLSGLMTAYSLGLIGILFDVTGAYTRAPHLLGTATALPFLYGPLHMLYVKYLLGQRRRFKLRDSLHFLPFAAFVGLLIPFFLEDAAYKLDFFAEMRVGQIPLVLKTAAAGKAIHGLAYMAAALIVLRRPNRAGVRGVRRVRWLWRITLLATAVWVLNAVLLAGRTLDFWQIQGTDAIVGIAMAIAVYIMGYLGIRQGTLVTGDPATSRIGPKYAHSGLGDQEAQDIADRLRSVLKDEQLYLNRDLSLKTLAETLSIGEHELSQAINDRIGKSFFELISTYRVEHARQLLLDPDYSHLSMEGIAFEAGFNSRSAFYAAFRKHVGKTPSEVRQGG